MNPILAGVALAVVAGAVVVVSARDARVVALAMALVLLLSAVIADPVAAPVGLAARAIGALLAAYLLWIAARERPEDGLPTAPTEGSRVGWPAEILLAAAAAVVGFAAQGLGAPAIGPVEASVAGFTLAALAVAPVLTGRDVIRVGVGLLLLLTAALLIRAALGGTPAPLEQLVAAGLVIAVAGTVAALGRSARRDGVGGFGFATGPGFGGPVARPPEAHPLHRGEPLRTPPVSTEQPGPEAIADTGSDTADAETAEPGTVADDARDSDD